jgi:hypothetical protein
MAMDNVDIISELGCLVQFDINARQAYEQVISLISSSPARDHLFRFQRDHGRHIAQLSAVIRAFEVEPPAMVRDLRGFVLDGFPAFEDSSSVAYTLLAMKSNEKLINQAYRHASLLDFSPNIKELVSRNYEDEQIHLRFVEEVLADRRWMNWNIGQRIQAPYTDIHAYGNSPKPLKLL